MSQIVTPYLKCDHHEICQDNSFEVGIEIYTNNEEPDITAYSPYV